MVGRVGDWDVGIMDLQTAESETLPSENLGVVRLRRRVLNPNSYVGGIVTSRLGSGGHHNIVYGADAIFRVVGNDYLVLNWAQSFDDQERGGTIDPLDRSIMRFNWERRGSDGLTYALDVARAGDVFYPEMGYLRRSDFTKGQMNLGYGWRPGPGARLFTYALQADGAVFRRNVDGEIESAEVGPTVVLETWGRHVLNLSVPFRYESLTAPFSLPEGNSVPAWDLPLRRGAPSVPVAPGCSASNQRSRRRGAVLRWTVGLRVLRARLGSICALEPVAGLPRRLCGFPGPRPKFHR